MTRRGCPKGDRALGDLWWFSQCFCGPLQGVCSPWSQRGSGDAVDTSQPCGETGGSGGCWFLSRLSPVASGVQKAPALRVPKGWCPGRASSRWSSLRKSVGPAPLPLEFTTGSGPLPGTFPKAPASVSKVSSEPFELYEPTETSPGSAAYAVPAVRGGRCSLALGVTPLLHPPRSHISCAANAVVIPGYRKRPGRSGVPCGRTGQEMWADHRIPDW